jgi:hypothetical protein
MEIASFVYFIAQLYQLCLLRLGRGSSLLFNFNTSRGLFPNLSLSSGCWNFFSFLGGCRSGCCWLIRNSKVLTRSGIMLRNFIKLELLFALFYRLGRLDIVVFHLLAKEARGFEVFHGLAIFFGVLVVVLYVTNHSLGAI